ncbi:hypothetical protein [Flavobacterium rhizosphaerae]|uniref:Uncharacterized protein n=1 Tax=Flavobacterium rhizosphaerae TaxID=3163298 RepID=A0ABW8YWP8_9FLAO
MANEKPKFGKLQKTLAAFMAVLGFSKEDDIPINAEEKKLDLTAEQMVALEKALGKAPTAQMIKAMDGEIKAALHGNLQLKAIQDELDAILKEQELIQEDLENPEAKTEDDATVSAKLERLNTALSAETKKRKELEATVQELLKDSEGDVPAAIIKLNKATMEHSATHLFASGKQYDAFDKRPWNARLRDGGVKATDFTNDSKSTIPTLQGDLEHFVRQNPTVIESLFNDYEELPAEWDRVTNVQDRISSGFVIAAEIVQGRKKGWAPKQKFKFDTEEGKVYRKKIDITFDGYELQEMENTWVGQIKNMEGSHPWKMSFVGFLLSELAKQQKVDDRIAQINGIFSVGGDGDTPGANVNSQNGLRYLWWYYRDVLKKYRPFNIGLPTEANIVDYIEKAILMIPEENRKDQGLEIQISDRWKRAYNKKAGEIYNLQYSTDQGKKDYSLDHPIDRPNFKFQVLKDQTQTDFIGFTYSKNIQDMQYRPEERNMFTFTFEKRDMHIFADYRRGIRFKFVGTKTVPGDPKEFEKQVLWSNNAPIFSNETKVPVFDDKSGILKVNYPNMIIDETWVTDIADIEGNLVPGQIIRITGNASLPSVKNLKDNAKFDLQGDYALNTPGTITLFVNEDKTLKELARTTTAPEVAVTDVGFTEAVIDANEGNVFRFNGEDTTAITNILNGVESQSIKIYGTDTADVDVTLSTTGNIHVTVNATLASAADYIQLTNVAGTWMETKRVIA